MSMENSIVVKDWPSSMGVTALLRIVPNNKVRLEGNRLYYSNELWEDFSNVLFEYFIDHYSRAAKTEHYLMRYLALIKKHSNAKNIKERAIFKNAIDWLNSTIKESLHKVRKYFIEEEPKIRRLLKGVKDAFNKYNFSFLEKTIYKIVSLLYQKEINEKLTLNYVKAIILKPAVGQVSFLNSSKNYYKLTDQKQLFYVDFIKPIIEENIVKELLAKESYRELEELLNKSSSTIAKKWRNRPLDFQGTVKSWFENYAQCAVFSNEWGTIPYEEKLFMPLGSTSLNDRWDGQEINMLHISSLARLVLFLAPLGCVIYKKKSPIREHTVFSFLYMEGQCLETLVNNNRFGHSMENRNQLVEALRVTYNSPLYTEEESRRTTVLIEWYTENKTKKTLLDIRLLKPNFIKHIMSGDIISKIYPFNFREVFLQECLSNRDTKLVIVDEIYRQLEERTLKRNIASLKNTLLLRELTIEGVNFDTSQSLTNLIYLQGYELRTKLLSRENNRAMESLYQISMEKKLDSILYRLLKMSKNGNRRLFYDLIQGLSEFANLKLMKEFNEILDYKVVSDARFATISLAFITGLTSVRTNEGDTNSGKNN